MDTGLCSVTCIVGLICGLATKILRNTCLVDPASHACKRDENVVAHCSEIALSFLNRRDLLSADNEISFAPYGWQVRRWGKDERCAN